MVVMKKLFAIAAGLGVAAAAGAGEFVLTGSGTEVTASYNGKPFLVSNEVMIGNLRFGGDGVRSAASAIPGGKAVNIWNEKPEVRFREEIAASANGRHLDLTYLTEYNAFQPHPSRALRIRIPFRTLAGAKFTARVGRSSRVRIVRGEIPADAPDGKWLLPPECRQAAFSGGEAGNLVVDFNVLGVGDFLADYSNNALKGFGAMRRVGDMLELTSGTTLPVYGGHVGAKWRFYAGSDADYARYHASDKFTYTGEFDRRRLFSFGGNASGKDYTPIGVAPFDAKRQAGWLGKAPRIVPGAGQGAFYGAAAGKNGVFKVSGLAPGLYWVTVGAGNAQKRENRFSIVFNGEKLAENITVPAGKAVTVSRAVRVDRESAELKLSGDFLISTFALQCVLTDMEDVSVRRGIWHVDGYEPAVIYRNEHYKKAAVFPASLQRFDLPEPGREAIAPLKPMAEPESVVVADRPGMEWRYRARISAWGPGNQGTLEEYAQPAAMTRRLDELESKQVNAILVSSMLSRHTYFAHLARAEKFLRTLTDAAHKRKMKVIDHQDLTLLWNIDGGYRVASERLGEVNVAIRTMLPGPQFCIMNPEFRKKYTAYLKNFIAATRIDGLMIDESHFFPHGCGCQYCREAFHRDTGWYLPMNELDKRIGNQQDELWKRFLVWRKRQVGNWWVELKKAAREVNPDFSFMAYSTHYGFFGNWSSLTLGLDLTEFARGVDFLGTEIMTRNVLMSHRALIPYRKMKELLRHAYNTPIFGLVYSMDDWDLAYFGWAVNNMNAQSTWETLRNCPPGKSDYHALGGENMDYARSERVCEAALLFSIQSREWNRGVSMLPELMGTAQLLEQLHVPYTMLGEMSLKPGTLAKFKLLYVGAAACLSDAQLAVIKEFAANGGTVITGAIAGTQDEVGNYRGKWGFADVYGYDLMPVKFRKFKQLPGTRETLGSVYNLVPAASGNYAGCEVVSYADAGRIVPAILRKNYGKGRFIHHAAMLTAPLAALEYTINQKCQFKNDPVLDRFCKELLRSEFAGADAGLRTDAPESVYLTWYRGDDGDILHFLNASGGNPACGQVIPAKSPKVPFPALARDITVSLPAMAVKEAYAVSPDFPGRKALTVKQENGKLTLTLPKELLKAYTIVRLKK